MIISMFVKSEIIIVPVIVTPIMFITTASAKKEWLYTSNGHACTYRCEVLGPVLFCIDADQSIIKKTNALYITIGEYFLVWKLK